MVFLQAAAEAELSPETKKRKVTSTHEDEPEHKRRAISQEAGILSSVIDIMLSGGAM